MDRNVPDTANKDVQDTVTSSESLQLIDFLATKVEEAKDQMITCCEEVNVKMQDQDNITKLNSDDVNPELVSSHETIETETSLQVSICEKEMPEKHVTCITDNNGVNGSEKRELSLELFKCPFVENSGITCAKKGMTDHTEDTPNEEKHLSSLNIDMEQNTATQDITGDIKEARAKSERRKEDLVESMASKGDSITLLPLMTNLSVSPLGEQSNCICTNNEDAQGNSDAREGDQCPHFPTGKTEKEENICSTTNISEPGATRCSSLTGEKATDQSSLWMCGKPIEQSDADKTRKDSSPHQIDTFVAEQNSTKEQDIIWKDSPEIQPVNIYLEKEGEPKCERILQPEGDIISDSRRFSVQDITSNEERQMIESEAGMKASPAKSTTVSPDPKAEVLLTEEEKEKSCENLLSNINQSKTAACNLIPNKIMESISNTDVAQQNFTKIPKTEETTMENAHFSTDIHINRKQEIVTCVENKSMLITVQSGFSSAEALPVLERVDDSGRETNADPEAQSSHLTSRAGGCAPSDLDTVGQASTSYTDSRSLDVEFLPDSQLQGIFESHSLEYPPHKASILDDPHKHSKNKSDMFSAEEQSGTKTPAPAPHKTNPNNVKDQVTERICDSSRQEDATDVVCGLIKELSNLNRLTMSMHRDLDSFKRLKFRRNRQSGKLLPHNNMTSTPSLLRKKREL
ncbi:break repair meiotic recombinase recruitment factor 1 [Sceloporus undulatus]|uniref:break repair meiotic recombinase recruitment factor 1 n=1 Tax=Sceloporus undulatus TaxID=8520 RepID=UPI001C4AA20B|nr:break repair meiotic recombinase recruitment factor 1 [Sceloporus undulatus]